MALTRKKRREGGREITHIHRKHTPLEGLIVVDVHTHTHTRTHMFKVAVRGLMALATARRLSV